MLSTEESLIYAKEQLENKGIEPTDEAIEDYLEAKAEYQMEMQRGN